MLAAQLLLLGKARQGLVRDVRSAFFERLAHQSLGWHPDRRAGDLATRVISDVDAIESSMLRDLSDLLEDALTFLIGGGIVIALQPVTRLAQAKTAAHLHPRQHAVDLPSLQRGTSEHLHGAERRGADGFGRWRYCGRRRTAVHVGRRRVEGGGVQGVVSFTTRRLA